MKQPLVFAFKFLALTGVYLFTRSRTPKPKVRNPDKSVVVIFLLEYLKRILVYNAKLIRYAKDEVEILENDIRLFKAFLRDSARMRYKNEAVKQFLGEIRGVICEGDDLIIEYLNQAAEIRDQNFFQRAFCGQMKLVGVAKKVAAIRAKVKNIYGKSKVVFAAKRIGPAAPQQAAEEGTKEA